MLKKLFAVALSASLVLSACSNDKKDTEPAKKAAATKSKDGKVTAIPGGGNLIEGTGNDSVDIVRFSDPKAPVMVRVTTAGNELSFVGVTADRDGKPGQTLVDTIGAYDGLSVIADPKADTIAITSLDPWTVQFLPVTKAAEFKTDQKKAPTATGERPAVLVVPDGTTTFEVTFETTETFASVRPFRVMFVSGDGTTKTVFNRAGAKGTGTVNVPGPGFLVVSDLGSWTITGK